MLKAKIVSSLEKALLEDDKDSYEPLRYPKGKGKRRERNPHSAFCIPHFALCILHFIFS
jgi:hypothetical protein